MVYIGCHLTVTNGYEAMGHQMVDFGGNTFAWFTRNPRGGKSKDIEPADVQALSNILETPNDDEGYIHEIATVKSWF